MQEHRLPNYSPIAVFPTTNLPNLQFAEKFGVLSNKADIRVTPWVGLRHTNEGVSKGG
ncbi:MAG: hypothetical protein DFNUSKGM_000448 [Candidatus Fervidibacter sacchari]